VIPTLREENTNQEGVREGRKKKSRSLNRLERRTKTGGGWWSTNRPSFPGKRVPKITASEGPDASKTNL